MWFPRQLAWASETVLESDELARDIPGAGEIMERHQELKTDIDTREEK